MAEIDDWTDNAFLQTGFTEQDYYNNNYAGVSPQKSPDAFDRPSFTPGLQIDRPAGDYSGIDPYGDVARSRAAADKAAYDADIARAGVVSARENLANVRKKVAGEWSAWQIVVLGVAGLIVVAILSRKL